MMESKILNRVNLMYIGTAVLFMIISWSYASLQWRLPKNVVKAVSRARGSIVTSDGMVLARSARDDEGNATRVYPLKQLAGQLVGFMDSKSVAGIEGIEHAYNHELTNGQDVVLTINTKIQAQAEQSLAKWVPPSKGDSASVVVLETRTGRILAAASYPPFDPNDWKNQPPSVRRNRPFLDVYEPGSPIKSLTVSAALNENLVTPNTVYDTPMSRYVGTEPHGHRIGDAVNHPARLSTTDVLRYSSNVGISHIVERIPKERLRNYLLEFGYGEKVDLGPVATERGVVQPLRRWDALVATTNGFGQGMSGTTLHLAAAYNVLANDGLYIPPKIVEGSSPGKRREVLSNPQSRQIKPMLQTALEGISHIAGVNGYSCGGKTGTAQMVGSSGRYLSDQYNSTYAGFCQTSDPRFTVAVMVHGARVNYHGSQLAAGIFQEVSASIISMWGIPPENLPPAPPLPSELND